ncbi:type VI secretion system baseplate subunit TssG [Aquabacterium sp.]|uniref:type VI secretion system baseplate subunit TssG n=1 Tax=Aquabacterium sp. TaxID=1872578 RepID=UPI002C69A9F1|nr:type VI secretion system baseplate subunit TssG [Aquabacterium sp.]HSW03538.1 type VI secretion system baseplate subunit TssG [Aquabacterium sp.]
MSPMERLRLEPARFTLDQAAAVVAPGKDPADIAFRTVSRLGAPGGEVAHALPPEAELVTELVTPTFGLIGPGGVLPRHYTAWVDGESRKRSTALHAFLDLISRRFTGLYVKAGAKYRPTRSPRQAEQVLAAAIGLGTPHLSSALATPLQALLYHAGGLSSRARSAERLRGMLSEETGNDVRIIEFAGGWLRLPPAEQSRLSAPGLPGRHVQLGTDAAVGLQFWDPAARFLVNLGPLSLSDFRSLLPGAALHTRLVELTRLQVGLEQDFALNPVLAAAEVPPLKLGAPGTGSAQLGWTSWLTAPRPRQHAAGDAVLRPMAPSTSGNEST